MNEVLDIKNLGKIKFIFSIIDFDYPRTFVCKRVNSGETELFLFDEIDHGDNFIDWICTRVSVDDIDRLNCGLTTLESCFFGPRESQKDCYKVTSKQDEPLAIATHLKDASLYIKNNHTFVDQFVDDTHGAELRSAIYEKPIAAIVVKPEKFADPMLGTTRMTSSSNEFKAFINSLPFAIETRGNRMCLSEAHSLVIYFEVSDKKIVEDDQCLISDTFDDNSETHQAFNAVKAILKSDSSSEEVIDAFKGDKKSIEKASAFISELRRNNEKNDVLLEFVDNSSISKRERYTYKANINKHIAERIKNKKDEVIKIIDKKDNHDISTFDKIGQFLMLDTTGRKKFKFQSTEKVDEGIIYGGFADAKVSGLTVDDHGNKKYKVRIQVDVLNGAFGKSKPIYTLLEILGEEKEPDQVNLFTKTLNNN